MDLSNLSSNWKKLQHALSTQRSRDGETEPAVSKLEFHTHPRNKVKFNEDNYLVGQKRKRQSTKRTNNEGRRFTSGVGNSALGKSTKRTKIDHVPERLQSISISHSKSKGKSECEKIPWMNMSSSKLERRIAAKKISAANADQKVKSGARNGPPITQDRPTTSIPFAEERAKIGKYVALDCEMVGVGVPTAEDSVGRKKSYTIPVHAVGQRKGASDKATHSMIARVSIVTYNGSTYYDVYVAPPEDCWVADYRTEHSGITAWHLSNKNPNKPRAFDTVQREVSAILQNRILIGHALDNDLAVLGLAGSIPRSRMRDTSMYPKYRAMAQTTRIGDWQVTDHSKAYGRTLLAPAEVFAKDQREWLKKNPNQILRRPKLQSLAKVVLGWDIQSGKDGHSSVEDARAAMELFKIQKIGFEQEARRLYGDSAVISTPALPLDQYEPWINGDEIEGGARTDNVGQNGEQVNKDKETVNGTATTTTEGKKLLVAEWNSKKMEADAKRKADDFVVNGDDHEHGGGAASSSLRPDKKLKKTISTSPTTTTNMTQTKKKASTGKKSAIIKASRLR